MLFPFISRQIYLRARQGLSCYRGFQNMTRGALIIFEGCDRSGKTTQCKKLVEVLNDEGTPAQMWRFPDRETAIGRVINDYLEQKVELEDHAVHLLFAANRWEAVPRMKELLNEGKTLIVDRYSFSGVAFTAAKEGMDLAWCKEPEIGLPKPDAVIFMTLSPEVAAARGAYGGERYERTDFQTRVATNYDELKDRDWKIIDASKSIDELHVELKDLVKQIIEESKTRELSQLWTKPEPTAEPPLKKKCVDPTTDIQETSSQSTHKASSPCER